MAGGERQDGGEEERVDLLHLPMPAAEIFGRRDETAWLERCWSERAHVATIVAPGGVGKSALVCDWLRKMQGGDWPGADRVYGWSFYSQGTKETQSSADLFIHEALVFFGDPEPDAGSPWDKGERLARLVRRRRVLLVLDGMEPLQWGSGTEEGRIKDPALERLVWRLGERNAGLCVITSRVGVREVAGFAPEKSRKLDLRHADGGGRGGAATCAGGEGDRRRNCGRRSGNMGGTAWRWRCLGSTWRRSGRGTCGGGTRSDP